jgi:HEAT repeat protein
MPSRHFLWAVFLVTLGLGVAGAIWWNLRLHYRATLQDPNPAVRAAAIRAMGFPGDVNLLIGALQDDNADVRLLAAQHLGGRGPESGRRADALIPILKDSHPGVRREAAEALCWIGAEAVPALCRALADPDPRIRAGAALALTDVCDPKGGEDRRGACGEVTRARE